MITVHQVWANYPNSDLLPIDVHEDTTVRDIEDAERRGELGDTLFLYIVRELCTKDFDRSEAYGFIEGAIADLEAVSRAILTDEEIE